MPSVDEVLASFTPAGEPEAAAGALATQLEAAGFNAHVPRSFRAYGVNSVHVHHDDVEYHVLVHTGTADELRPAVERFFGLPALETEPRLVSAVEPPPDVDFLFSDDLLAAFERRMAREKQPDLRTRVGDVGALVAQLRPRLEAAADVPLTGDLQTVTTGVDTIVQRLRHVGPQEPMPEGALAPMRTLFVLGLIATEAMRDALGCGRLVKLGYGGQSEIERLGDAEGVPGIFTGNAALNVAGKVLKQFHNGEEDSVRFMSTVILAQHVANPPDEPAPRDGEVAADASPEEVEALLLERARYAPFAGFLAVAMADDRVEDREVEAFQSAMAVVEHPFLRRLLDKEGAETRLARLRGDPDLTARALAAAGVLIDREGDPAAARAALKAPLQAVAEAGGELRPAEAQALEVVEGLLDGGLARATEGGVDQGIDAYAEKMEAAKLGPWAAFLRVAAADGAVGIEELAAFANAWESTTDPLLRMMQAMHPVSGGQARVQLQADATLGRESIRRLARLLRSHPEGDAARAALVAMLERVVAVHGSVRPAERKVLDEVVQDLKFNGMTGCMVWSGAFVFAPTVAAWQLLSAATGLTAWFVPVAALLQVVFLTLALLITRRENTYGFQVGTGLAFSVFGAVPIAITSVLVGLLFPDVAAANGGVVFGAIGGFLGTIITGLVWSMLAGLVLRRTNATS